MAAAFADVVNYPVLRRILRNERRVANQFTGFLLSLIFFSNHYSNIVNVINNLNIMINYRPINS